MDAGLAAVIGALVGAAASPVVTLLSRQLDRADRKRQDAAARRLEIRDALLNMNEAFSDLLTARHPDQERNVLMAAVAKAQARLELVLDAADAPVAEAASRVSTMLILRHPNATKASTLFGIISAAWYRGTRPASEVWEFLLTPEYEKPTDQQLIEMWAEYFERDENRPTSNQPG